MDTAGIQHFLDVDPHFGTRKDLVDLVAAAHGKGIRIILDIIFNHSGFCQSALKTFQVSASKSFLLF